MDKETFRKMIMDNYKAAMQDCQIPTGALACLNPAEFFAYGLWLEKERREEREPDTPTLQEYKEVDFRCPFCRNELRFAIAVERKEEKMEKRKIEVVKLGEKQECLLNDRVSIEFSPNELQAIKYAYTKSALNAESYSLQTEEREMHGIFEKAFGMWEKKRKERDAEGV